MGMSSLSIAVSGLHAAQTGLYVTGHNMANSGTEGFSRQRPVQTDFLYQHAGNNNAGDFQKGLGADIKGIVQLRDRFLDVAFRTETSRLGFYAAQLGTGIEIESVIGETQSQYNFQSVFIDMWDALNELSEHTEGFETRGNFIATAVSLVTKATDIYDRLFEYQRNLDGQIRAAVIEVNDLVAEINRLNRLIAHSVSAGDNPNDYRDQRNVCMDQLSEIIPADFRMREDSTVTISCDGSELLNGGRQNIVGLKFLAQEYSFVEPVLTFSDEILPASTPIEEFSPLLSFTRPVSALHGNDFGRLMGLMLSRGTRPTTYLGVDGLPAPDPTNPVEVRRFNYDVFSQENAFIPQVMRDVDLLVHSIVTLINDSLAPADATGMQYPDAPFDLNGDQSYVEVFSRRFMPRWDATDQLIPEDPNNYFSLYSVGNIEVNPILLQAGGTNLLALSLSGDRSDNRLALDLIERWGTSLVNMDGEYVSVNDGYRQLITSIGTRTSSNQNFVNEQNILVEKANDKRSYIMSVSLDEELRNMMIYQHAYNASARIVNVVDSMLDRLINNTGA